MKTYLRLRKTRSNLAMTNCIIIDKYYLHDLNHQCPLVQSYKLTLMNTNSIFSLEHDIQFLYDSFIVIHCTPK